MSLELSFPVVVATSQQEARRLCGEFRFAGYTRVWFGGRESKYGSEGCEPGVREWRDHLGAHDNKSVTETGERHLFFVKPMVWVVRGVV